MTTTHTYIVGGSSGGTSDGTGTLNHMYGSYFAGSGISTEANAQAEVTNAVTMDQLYSDTVGFVSAPTGTLVSRIGGSTGNMTISYSSESTTTPAVHTDTTHTDSIAATNLVNCQGHMTAGNIRYCSVGTRLSATSPISWCAACFDYGTVGNTGKAVSGTTAQYVPHMGPVQSPGTTESNTQNIAHNAGTWQGLFARISANTTAVGSTISSRLNGLTGNQTLSVGSAATGNFYDSTHTDSIADGDQVNYKIAVGDTNSITLFQIRSEIVGLYSQHDTYCHGTGSTDEQSGNTAGTFFNVGGGIFTNTTEAQHVTQCHTALTTSRLRCQFGGGRASASLFSRVAGSNGNQAITPWVAGFQEDTTHTDSVSADTSFNHEVTDSTGAGAVNDFGIGLSLDDGSVSQPSFSLNIVQHSGAIHGNTVPGSSSSVVLGSTPTVGNLLIAVIGVNIAASSVTVNTGSWTPFCATRQIGGGAPNSLVMMALYRYVQPGDTATLPAFWTAGSTYWTHTVWEIGGVNGTWNNDFLFAHTVPQPAANGSAFPTINVPGKCLAFACTASYNGSSNPSYSGAWTVDETHNNNANYGSASGAHRFMTANQLIDGAPTQGTAAPYGAMFFALNNGGVLPTGTPYVRSKAIYAENGSIGALETYNTPNVGNLWLAYVNCDRGQTSGITFGGSWTNFVSQNGNGHPMIVGLYRYVQGGDTSVTPTIVSANGSFSSVTVIELSGGFNGTFGTDHVSDKSGDQASGGAITTTSDTTTAADEFALLAWANYNASSAGNVSGTNWVNEAFLDASDYGAWGVGENTYPTTSSTVQGTVTPLTTTDYTAYIQSIFEAPGAGATINASITESMSLTETDTNQQDDVASVTEAMSLTDSVSQTHTQPPPMPIIVVIL